MKDFIKMRRNELAASGVAQNDILSLMIQSSQEEGKYSLNDEALVSSPH